MQEKSGCRVNSPNLRFLERENEWFLNVWFPLCGDALVLTRLVTETGRDEHEMVVVTLIFNL